MPAPTEEFIENLHKKLSLLIKTWDPNKQIQVITKLSNLNFCFSFSSEEEICCSLPKLLLISFHPKSWQLVLYFENQNGRNLQFVYPSVWRCLQTNFFSFFFRNSLISNYDGIFALQWFCEYFIFVLEWKEFKKKMQIYKMLAKRKMFYQQTNSFHLMHFLIFIFPNKFNENHSTKH